MVPDLRFINKMPHTALPCTIRSFLRIWSNLLKKFLMENFHFLCSDFRTTVFGNTAQKHIWDRGKSLDLSQRQLHDQSQQKYENKVWKCSDLTVKTLERRHWRRSGVSTFNFEHISRLVLVFLLSTLSK